jgi:hypothetical protein
MHCIGRLTPPPLRRNTDAELPRRGHQRRFPQPWQPTYLETHAIEGAWVLQDRYVLNYWDALIVSSAQQQG